MPTLAERMIAVVERMKLDIRKKWWWWLVVPLGTVLYGRLQDWISDYIWALFSRHLNVQTLKWLANVLYANHEAHPIAVFVGLFLLVLLGFFVHAYFETRGAGIVGNADLLVIRLNLPDLHIIDHGAAYEINLGVFVRASIAAVDKPRTVRAFEIEMVVAENGTRYAAQSERELGEYYHAYRRSRSNQWGNMIEERMREPMEDLAAKARNPIPPGTHVEGWLRFELRNVRGGHEPKQDNVTIHIVAVDAAGHRHPLETNGLAIRALDNDHEYAQPVRD